ncbi:MAG: hypothetical protein QGG53_14615 [Planctomycetota bacterium]|nr:hypothetical protein [Planctomycetota bacterium]
MIDLLLMRQPGPIFEGQLSCYLPLPKTPSVRKRKLDEKNWD